MDGDSPPEDTITDPQDLMSTLKRLLEFSQRNLHFHDKGGIEWLLKLNLGKTWEKNWLLTCSNDDLWRSIFQLNLGLHLASLVGYGLNVADAKLNN